MLQCSVCSSSIIQLKNWIWSNKQIKIKVFKETKKIGCLPGQNKKKKSTLTVIIHFYNYIDLKYDHAKCSIILLFSASLTDEGKWIENYY